MTMAAFMGGIVYNPFFVSFLLHKQPSIGILIIAALTF